MVIDLNMSRWRHRREPVSADAEEQKTPDFAVPELPTDDEPRRSPPQADEREYSAKAVDTCATRDDDPRRAKGAELGKAQRAAMGQIWLSGRNTQSFDPASTFARPAMRIICGPRRAHYGRPVRPDDVIVVPEFLCTEDDWGLYHRLIDEVRQLQADGEKQSEWVSWHEGAHLITQNPSGSPAFKDVVRRMCAYLSVEEDSGSTRFNWYRDSQDWKPFHHDSAAFNEERARQQNCTVGISLGATRELAFRHARSGELVYFPQSNGTLFYFGRDVNIRWQHGINALRPEEQDGGGRISIICFGWCSAVVEEEGSPPLLRNDARGLRDQTLCRDFLRGYCFHGDGCEFSHGRADGKRWQR